MILVTLYLVILIYCIAIIFLIYGFSKINDFDSISLQPITKFSIVVPFRDEAENLPILLNSFFKLNYPNELFEVLLVDDDSVDEFKTSGFEFDISVIKNNRTTNSPKKDAITTAMQVAKNDWIITTDADCVVNKNWLLALDNYIQSHEISMIAGAVSYTCDKSFLHQFQQLDLASLQGATIGSFGLGKGFMCNGANFGYTKSFFKSLNGFKGNDKIASGDDVFLLQKALNQFPEKVYYLKSEHTIVVTQPVNDWKSLFYQRVRWASKTASYQSSFGKFLGLLVFAGNASFCLVVFGLFFNAQNTLLLRLVLFTKLIVDFILIYKTNNFLKTKTKFYVISSLFYPFFSVSVVMYSLFGKYEWKGRRFK